MRGQLLRELIDRITAAGCPGVLHGPLLQQTRPRGIAGQRRLFTCDKLLRQGWKFRPCCIGRAFIAVRHHSDGVLIRLAKLGERIDIAVMHVIALHGDRAGVPELCFSKIGLELFSARQVIDGVAGVIIQNRGNSAGDAVVRIFFVGIDGFVE